MTFDSNNSAAAIRCRLITEITPESSWYPNLTVELSNSSAVVVELEYQHHPLQYLNVIVSTEGGEIVSRPSWSGGHFVPYWPFRASTPPRILRLEAGEILTHPIGIIGRIENTKLIARNYVAEAVFKYRDFEIKSAPIKFFIGPIPDAYRKFLIDDGSITSVDIGTNNDGG